MIWTALFLCLVTPKPVDTVIHCVGCSYIIAEPEQMEYYDTTFVFHSLSQLPKDTTKRWDVTVRWRWNEIYKVDPKNIQNMITVRAIYGDDKVDSTGAVWRFVPDSSITESEGRR